MHEQFYEVCISMDCEVGDHSFIYPWPCIIDMSAYNDVFNDEPWYRNDVKSCFQTNLDLAYSITMVTHIIGSIVKNESAFLVVILVHHQKWWYGVPLDTCFGLLVHNDGTLNSGRYISVVLSPVDLLASPASSFLFEPCKMLCFSKIMHYRMLPVFFELDPENVRLVPWSECFPDLSEIKNVWWIVVERLVVTCRWTVASCWSFMNSCTCICHPIYTAKCPDVKKLLLLTNVVVLGIY